jgi:hypothetical protein
VSDLQTGAARQSQGKPRWRGRKAKESQGAPWPKAKESQGRAAAKAKESQPKPRKAKVRVSASRVCALRAMAHVPCAPRM